MANYKTRKDAIRGVLKELIQSGDTEFLQFIIRHNQMFPDFREVMEEVESEHRQNRTAEVCTGKVTKHTN